MNNLLSANNGGEGENEQKNEETKLHLSMLDNSRSATYIAFLGHRTESKFCEIVF